uniref:TAF2 n=1 Tax=Arundo donax TaxID=35708 RepID=A0A0A9EAG3_ARUDO
MQDIADEVNTSFSLLQNIIYVNQFYVLHLFLSLNSIFLALFISIFLFLFLSFFLFYCRTIAGINSLIFRSLNRLCTTFFKLSTIFFTLFTVFIELLLSY